MPRFELLVGSEPFWMRARQDIAQARERVLVQAMTFEGDRAGLSVAQAIADSGARDRRVLVDTYSRYVVSDHFVFSPWARRDPVFREEVRQTSAMFERLSGQGVGVVFTNPLGFLGTLLPARNHKKLLVMDDVAYLGGINFSDHNFAWHDLMVRCDDRAIADYLALDFARTYRDEPLASEAQFPAAEFFSLSGANNHVLFERLAERMDRARRRIDVVSPYLTFPFCEMLARAQRRGVQVRVFTPFANNKGIVRDYLLWAAGDFGFDVFLYDQMSHMKAMLIDDEALVVGSSNFDFVSYHAQAEYVAVLSDQALIEAFTREVLESIETRSMSERPDAMRGRMAYFALKVAESVTRFAGTRLIAAHERVHVKA
jgi:cardiolipin synthase